MQAEILQVPGTEKHPYACVIKMEHYITDRICDKEKAQKVLSYIHGESDIKNVTSKLLKNLIELKMIKTN